jgi:YidC/Oxa1 family membrane protein insertase
MIAVVVWWQGLLDGLGSVIAFFYGLIPNYGVTIILFTLAIRVVLLPLGIKQIRSMQSMQAIQPKVKALQQKYKGNRQKLNEEMMALYKEHGVNPLSGCLPMLAQFPVLIALYAVLRFPVGLPHIPHNDPNPVVGRPQDSQLYVDITDQKTKFLGANLLCSAKETGNVKIGQGELKKVPDARELGHLDCGRGIAVRIPYYVFALAMMGTTFYQQRQMQKATPQQSQQQQALTRIFPLLFGFWGFLFPASLVVYWTTTNLVQIAQQHYMLPKGQPAAAEKGPRSDGEGRRKPGPQRGRLGPAKGQPSAGSRPGRSALGSKGSRDGGAAGETRPNKGSEGKPAVERGEGNAGQIGGGSGGSGSRGSGRRSNAGSRKKRRKR